MVDLESLYKIIDSLSDVELSELPDRLEITVNVGNLRDTKADLSSWLNQDIIGVSVDKDPVDSWKEIFEYPDNCECFINLVKSRFIEVILQPKANAGKFVFFSLNNFEEWLKRIGTPFSVEHPFNIHDRTVLWVRGVNSAQIGSKLSVVPLDDYDDYFFDTASLDLPIDEDIRSQVHVVSNSMVVINLEGFRLPDESINVEYLKPIFRQYEELLASCLVKEFYSEDRVVVSGLKRIQLSIGDGHRDVDIEDIEQLESAVRWVYQERTETRLLLLMDRLSLDLPERCNMLPNIYIHLVQALEQARSRYDFVIMDRKEAHAKELSDLQKDIKTATDNYSKTANELVSGLLKDALSSIFVLAIGLFSRLIGRDGVFESFSVKWLFYGLGLYLIMSASVRIYIGLKGLNLSLEDLKYWKDALRNHMSESEFSKIVYERTKEYKKLYNRSAFGVGVIYIVLSVAMFCVPTVLAAEDKPVEVRQMETPPSADLNSFLSWKEGL